MTPTPPSGWHIASETELDRLPARPMLWNIEVDMWEWSDMGAGTCIHKQLQECYVYALPGVSTHTKYTPEPRKEDEPWRAKLRAQLEDCHEGWGDSADDAEEHPPRTQAVMDKAMLENGGEYMEEDLMKHARVLEKELMAIQAQLSGINPEGIKDAVEFIRKIAKPQEDSDLWICSREDDLSDFEPDEDAMKEAAAILAKLEGAQG